MKLSQELKNAPTIPGFRAVEESRKWKEAAGLKIKDMSAAEMREYLDKHYPSIPRAKSRAYHQ